MKYVVKEPPRAGLVADADGIMREFNRAMAVVYEDVDQNNVSSNSIQKAFIADPMEQSEVSTSIIGLAKTWSTGPGLPLSTFLVPHLVNQLGNQTLDAPTETTSGDYEERTENTFWEYIEVSAGTKLSLDTLSLSAASELTVIANGQLDIGTEAIANGARRVSVYDIRILDNGSPLDSIATVSVMTNNGWVPFHASVRKTFPAGDHTFRVQIRDRSAGKAASVVKNTALCAFGFVR